MEKNPRHEVVSGNSSNVGNQSAGALKDASEGCRSTACSSKSLWGSRCSQAPPDIMKAVTFDNGMGPDAFGSSSIYSYSEPIVSA